MKSTPFQIETRGLRSVMDEEYPVPESTGPLSREMFPFQEGRTESRSVSSKKEEYSFQKEQNRFPGRGSRSNKKRNPFQEKGPVSGRASFQEEENLSVVDEEHPVPGNH